MQHISDSQFETLLSQAKIIIEERAEKLKRAVSARAAAQLRKNCTPDRSRFEEFGDDWELFIKLMLDVSSFASILNQVQYSRKDKRAAYTKELICQKADICGLDEQFKYHLCQDLGFDCEEPISLLKRKYESAQYDFKHSKKMMEEHAQEYNDESLSEVTRDFHFRMYSKFKDRLEKAERRMNEISQELTARGASVSN